jgi:hypothetical protein
LSASMFASAARYPPMGRAGGSASCFALISSSVSVVSSVLQRHGLSSTIPPCQALRCD